MTTTVIDVKTHKVIATIPIGIVANSKTLYKWDWGSFSDPVILDIQRSMYKEMGGSIEAGSFPGTIDY
ncbi:hypothetical protein V1503_20490 [Bacillus sp. SCS-151]|uniref:hypothetical protein n=1 Tax=Nanhaiella sioensis TaxID=3115293 RepID=UPI0039793C1C